MKRIHLALLIIFLVLLVDQSLKIWVKTSMYYGEEIEVIDDVFKLNFVENEGMAFGLTYGGKTGKLVLTIFRIIAVGFISFFIYNLIKKKAPRGLIVSMALILAGAAGNIIDSVFYGVIFEESSIRFRNIAEFLPEDGGYAPIFYGKVVDMLYFPVIRGFWPEWMPFLRGDSFLFFRPVFNIADSAITIGVLFILVFQKKYFTKHEIGEKQAEDDGVNEEGGEEHSELE